MIHDPETMNRTARALLAAMRERFEVGSGPVFGHDAIRILRVTDLPRAVSHDAGDEVLAHLEALGEVYRVDAGWTTLRPAHRSAPFAWAPRTKTDGVTLATFKRRILPPFGSEARTACTGVHDLCPLDAYRNRCLHCGTETTTPPDVWLGRGPVAAVWRAWLDELQGTTFAHGAALVEALGVEGVSDNVARAEAMLKHAQGVGWVVRGKNTPTTSQAFFDANGDNRRQGWVTSGYGPGPFLDDQIEYLRRWS